MMGLGRKAMLLVAFSLLTSAATAYAECAWVLWSEHVQWGAALGGREQQWDILETHQTRDRCMVDLKDQVAKLATHAQKRAAESRMKRQVDVSENAVSIRFLQEGEPPVGGLSTRFACLPDTVDPRGPKGR
jgi:hypothetical protein